MVFRKTDLLDINYHSPFEETDQSSENHSNRDLSEKGVVKFLLYFNGWLTNDLGLAGKK